MNSHAMGFAEQMEPRAKNGALAWSSKGAVATAMVRGSEAILVRISSPDAGILNSSSSESGSRRRIHFVIKSQHRNRKMVSASKLFGSGGGIDGNAATTLIWSSLSLWLLLSWSWLFFVFVVLLAFGELDGDGNAFRFPDGFGDGVARAVGGGWRTELVRSRFAVRGLVTNAGKVGHG